MPAITAGIMAASLAATTISSAVSQGIQSHHNNRQLSIDQQRLGIEREYLELSKKDFHKFSELGLKPAEGALLLGARNGGPMYKVYNGSGYSRPIPKGVNHTNFNGFLNDLYNVGHVSPRKNKSPRSIGTMTDRATVDKSTTMYGPIRTVGTSMRQTTRSTGNQTSPAYAAINFQYGGTNN